ncbi:hypothetical protein DH2020_045911 [Rehmannia glutinosa]|uniref:PCI domain-containing protein n=1 Tax=Rehmannia glutinosa TaxID=99300 RepID=A0ABR0UCV0_REHGL
MGRPASPASRHRDGFEPLLPPSPIALPNRRSSSVADKMVAYISMGEAHRRITEYLTRFSDAVSYQDGKSLSRLLSVSSNSAVLLSLADALNIFQDANRVIRQSEKYSQYADIIVPIFRALQSYRLRNLVESYMAFEKASKVGFNRKTPEKLKGAGSFLMKVFGVLAGKGPKRVGALYVTCQLFKTYFKLGTVHLCRSVIRSIETARIFDLRSFQSGIRMILKYLIPVKLSIGILPRTLLLEKFNLNEYSEVVLALKRGDLRLLRHALQEHEDRSGVYLVLEKLELQVYQRLVKKIYVMQKQKDPNKAHQIKLDVIVKALKWLEMDMDVDEVECIMSILIYKNLMKGYFAHKSKVVVLSKQDPFPKLNGKPVNS